MWHSRGRTGMPVESREDSLLRGSLLNSSTAARPAAAAQGATSAPPERLVRTASDGRAATVRDATWLQLASTSAADKPLGRQARVAQVAGPSIRSPTQPGKLTSEFVWRHSWLFCASIDQAIHQLPIGTRAQLPSSKASVVTAQAGTHSLCFAHARDIAPGQAYRSPCRRARNLASTPESSRIQEPLARPTACDG